MDRLDEALSIVRGMFAQERSTFVGRYYRTDDVINVPRPVQPGGPRVLVGGGGEQRTLRIAAKHADMTHWFPLGLEALGRKSAVLARHCEAIGRDPDAIERTLASPVMVAATEAEAAAIRARLAPDARANTVVATVDEAADALRPYLDAGFTGFTFRNLIYRTPEQIGVAGELLRRIGG
jgi:alkanesulfonate monooxygenase SsuD/methylene tetrahydromethanopterin reductase-like flavin-dependent oxidoreductase (luciferase family)